MSESSGVALPQFGTIYNNTAWPATNCVELWTPSSFPPVAPPTLSIAHGTALLTTLAVTSDPRDFPGEAFFTGALTTASNVIGGVSSTAGLIVGQALSCATLNAIPNGSLVTGIAGSTVTFDAVGGVGPPPSDPTSGAFLTVTGASFEATDYYPAGTIAVSVTPTTAVTIADYNFDGTSNAFNIGNGSAMRNATGQAVGEVMIVFASAGTFSISAEYTSTDPLFASAAFPGPWSLVVT